MAFGNEKCKDIVDNICPYCGEKLTMNKRSFANHVRWCKHNPRYFEILNNMRNKRIEQESLNTKRKRKHDFKCIVCGKEYSVICSNRELELNKYRKTCSDECSHKLTVYNTDHNAKRESIINANKNIGRIKKTYNKICEFCNKNYNTRRQSQRFCSKYCSTKFRHSNLKKDRDIKNYYKECCSFKFSLNEYPKEYNFTIVEQYGWYKAKNHGDNLNGVSRDHIYSVNESFKKHIDPYIISHPANCRLLRHNDNVSKYDKCDITIEQLINKIKIWHTKYGVYENKIDYKPFLDNNFNIEYYKI